MSVKLPPNSGMSTELLNYKFGLLFTVKIHHYLNSNRDFLTVNNSHLTAFTVYSCEKGSK